MPDPNTIAVLISVVVLALIGVVIARWCSVNDAHSLMLPAVALAKVEPNQVGKRPALDVAGLLHKGAGDVARDIAEGVHNPQALDRAKRTIERLQRCSDVVFVVVDGRRPATKTETSDLRRRVSAEALAKGKALLAEGKDAAANKQFKAAARPTPEMYRDLFLWLNGLDRKWKETGGTRVIVIQAIEEADPMIASLVAQGIADYAVTEDGDLGLGYAVDRVLFKLGGGFASKGVAFVKEAFMGRDYESSWSHKKKNKKGGLPKGAFKDWAHVDFAVFSSLLGCDHLLRVKMKPAMNPLVAYNTWGGGPRGGAGGGGGGAPPPPQPPNIHADFSSPPPNAKPPPDAPPDPLVLPASRGAIPYTALCDSSHSMCPIRLGFK
jgi:hypothetical protein